MSELEHGPMRPSRPWVALLLGVLSPGLGHVYAGRPWRGVFLVLALILLLLPLSSLIVIPLLGSTALTLAALAFRFGLPLVAPIDGALVARRQRVAPRTRWNGVLSHLLFGLVLWTMAVAGWKYVSSFTPAPTWRIPSGSMEPTLLIGDVVVTDFVHSGSAIARPGALVVFESPEEAGVLLIKRVVGLPGQTVEMWQGFLLVDGHPVTDGPNDDGRLVESLGAKPYQVEKCPFCSWAPVLIPEGKVFLLGDHRGRSSDSSVYGPVPISAIRGRALGVVWSRQPMGPVRWDRIGKKL